MATDRAVSLDEAISIAIRLQQNDQWMAAGDIYRSVLDVAPDFPDAVHYSGVLAHQEGRSELAVELIERSLELEPDRADWHSNLAIVLRDRLELDPGDCRLSARDCARSESRQRAQQSRRPSAGAGPSGRSGGGLSSRHSRAPRPFGRVHQPGHPAERSEADTGSGRLLLQGHHVQAEAPRSPDDCWRWRTAPSARWTRRCGSSKNGSRRNRTIPSPAT